MSILDLKSIRFIDSELYDIKARQTGMPSVLSFFAPYNKEEMRRKTYFSLIPFLPRKLIIVLLVLYHYYSRCEESFKQSKNTIKEFIYRTDFELAYGFWDKDLLPTEYASNPKRIVFKLEQYCHKIGIKYYYVFYWAFKE